FVFMFSIAPRPPRETCNREGPGSLPASGTLIPTTRVCIEAPAMDEIRRPTSVDETTVTLPADHPGFSDAAYRRRRDAIAGGAGDRRFMALQYIRHHSVPFDTPEPDVVHELIGHCNTLASPVFADLYERAGNASRRARTDEALEFFSRVWWFTLEFGVVQED